MNNDIVERMPVFIDLGSITEYLSENIGDVIGMYESYGCDRIEPINNGFEFSEFIRFDCDSSYHLTPSMTLVYEEQYGYMLECFLDEYKDKLPNGINKGNYWGMLKDHPLQNDFYDYELEFFNPALLRLSVRLTNDGKYTIELGVNYKDSPYYRLQHDETLLTLEYEPNKFQSRTQELLLNDMGNAFNQYLSKESAQ